MNPLAADLSHVTNALKELRTSQVTLEAVLSEHFSRIEELDPNDGFPKKMFRFSKEARERLAALDDLLTQASGEYNKALNFYGEDSKSITSTQEFFAVFKTFVTSYRVRFGFVVGCATKALLTPLVLAQKARSDNALAAERAARAALAQVLFLFPARRRRQLTTRTPGSQGRSPHCRCRQGHCERYPRRRSLCSVQGTTCCRRSVPAPSSR